MGIISSIATRAIGSAATGAVESVLDALGFGHSRFKSFKNVLNDSGFHMTNCYDIELGLPTKISKLASKLDISNRDLLDLISVCCYQVQASVGTIQTATVRTYGEPYEMPSGKSYEGLTLSFYLDNGGKLYRFFNEWYNAIYNSRTRTMGYLEDYAGTLTLDLTKRGAADSEALETFLAFLQIEGNNIVNKIVYTDFFPKSISPIPLSGMSGNTATQFDVGFNYRRAFVS